MDNCIKKGHELSQSLLELIVHNFLFPEPVPIQIKGVIVYGLTEYSLNGMIFRAHPCYKNETAWFDWVLIAWNISYNKKQSMTENNNSPDYVDLPNTPNDSANANQSAMLIPAKLICIIQDEYNKIYATIHSCLQRRKKISVLTYRW